MAASVPLAESLPLPRCGQQRTGAAALSTAKQREATPDTGSPRSSTESLSEMSDASMARTATALPAHWPRAPPGLEHLHGAAWCAVAPHSDGPGLTLVEILQRLKGTEPARVLKLRRLQPLAAARGSGGLAEALCCHFEQFGAVDEVHMVHSQARGSKQGAARCKPSGLGFVVMRSVDVVEAALRAGTEQSIFGASITLERFSVAQ